MDIQKTYWTNSENSMALHFPITKVNKEKRTVSGFASLDNVDRHGDIVTAEASKKAFDNFRGNIREMHGSSAVGKMLNFKEDSFFDPETKKKYNGIYVTAYISKGAQDAWEKCLDGTYSGFSIGGNINDAKMEKSDDGSGEDRRVIHDYDLHELSLVDSPANQLANFFSIQKMENGQTVIKGMASEIETENVFWCKTDEIVSTSPEVEKTCGACDAQMESIGWVEKADTEKFEAIEKVLDAYLKKDDAPGPTHEATTHDADPQNVTTSDQTINLYPDQNEIKPLVFSDGKAKVNKSDDEISLNKGGNEMAEDTTTEIEKSIDAEAVVEEIAVVDEAAEVAGESIEKAVAISEVDNAFDFEKMVNELKAFFGESITKNYTDSASAVEAMTKMFEETSTKVEKAIAELTEKYDALNKSITDMYGKIDYVDHRLNDFESASAVKKSSDLDGSAGATQIKKSIWQGAFLKL
jgi:hypothetical protein